MSEERATTRVLGTLGWDDSDRERERDCRLSRANRICATRRVDLLSSAGPTHSHPSLARSLARSMLWPPPIEPANEEQRFLALFLGVRCCLFRLINTSRKTLFLWRWFHLRQKSRRASAFLSCLPFPLMKLTNYQVITEVLAGALFGEVNFLPPKWGAREGTNFRNERRLLRRECAQTGVPTFHLLPLPASF